MSDWIYKILPEDVWLAAVEEGRFGGSGIDLQDGFIHFSNTTQVRETAAKHFGEVEGLVILAVEVARVERECPGLLRFEPSRGADLFAHLYGDLPLQAVAWSEPLPWDGEKGHLFPERLA